MGARTQMAFSPLRTKRLSFRQVLKPATRVALVALGGDKENVPKAVVVKAALELEVTLPLLGRCEGTDSRCQLRDEFRVVVLGHHF